MGLAEKANVVTREVYIILVFFLGSTLIYILIGYCGLAPFDCAAPDCKLDYGGGCDALVTRPFGSDTSKDKRPPKGDVPYAPQIIRSCSVPNTVALTYDDGPNIFTENLLDMLDEYNAKATFFLTGVNSNKGQIDSDEYPWKDVIIRMHNSGHQIASHTWSHQDLNAISDSQRYDQIINNERALHHILGGYPTYMRPPYSSCPAGSDCMRDLERFGYHVVYFDVDTGDYLNDAPGKIEVSQTAFKEALDNAEKTGSSLLVIGHDNHYQTVQSLTPFMLQQISTAGYRAVTVGECLGDPRDNWYRWKTKSKKPKKQQKKKPHNVLKMKRSEDGTCGVRLGITCEGTTFGKCCSGSNYCGDSEIHCGDGCQKHAGSCSIY